MLCLAVILGLLSSIYSLWHKQDVLTRTQKQLDLEKAENTKLQKQLKIVSTQDFLEKEARDKLFLVKPGEQEVLISQSLLEKKQEKAKEDAQKPNWQLWWEIFF